VLDRIGAKASSRWPTALLLVAAIVIVVLVGIAQRAGQTSGPSGHSPSPSGAASSPSNQASDPIPAFGPFTYVVGTVTAGPVCPVERNPPDPACAPRPVAGAVITATFSGQGEVARATTAPDGSYRILIDGYGTYTLTALPVQGLMNAPAPVAVTLDPMETRHVDFEYDTGIR
jgi:hypothetical protein